VIASEDAIAKGIRRIVALTGPEATKVRKLKENILVKLMTTLDFLHFIILGFKKSCSARKTSF